MSGSAWRHAFEGVTLGYMPGPVWLQGFLAAVPVKRGQIIRTSVRSQVACNKPCAADIPAFIDSTLSKLYLQKEFGQTVLNELFKENICKK